ncbi:MAG: glycosyltransferase [Acidimicrobiia bacterium]
MTPPASTMWAISLDAMVERITGSESVLEALKQLPNLTLAARSAEPDRAFRTLRGLADRHTHDPIAGYLAVYAMAEVASSSVDTELFGYLTGDDSGMRQHAAWALSRRRPYPAAFGPLVKLADEGGFPRMVAELAIENWLAETPELVWRVGSQMRERVAALAPQPRPRQRSHAVFPGMRIAQVLMQGRVDAGLTAAGSGDGGGLVTLQVGLAAQLADNKGVSDSYLITRRIPGEGSLFGDAREKIGTKGTLARLDFGPPQYLPTAEMWAYRADLERGLREFLLAEGPFDALHLRFADVGTFAASRVADELGIPIFFTLAPDPHVVIARAEEEGRLDRSNFAVADLESHFVFRAWLLDWMLNNATKLALLPRHNTRAQLERLLGVDIDDQVGRFVEIPEGVDFDQAERAMGVTGAGIDKRDDAIVELASRIGQLPKSRRGLPLMVTVGRLNRVKGMHRVVEALRNDARLSRAFNLVVVGGNLDSPTPEETSTLASISTALGGIGAAEAGLVLLGNQSHRAVSEILATAVSGLGSHFSPGGIYVCGSDKEEFGLAILEAMAAGLPIVAPVVGGPATYIQHEFTGYLADTTDLADLRSGMAWAADHRLSDVRSEAARTTVRDEYSLGAMADALVDLYQTAYQPQTAG